MQKTVGESVAYLAARSQDPHPNPTLLFSCLQILLFGPIMIASCERHDPSVLQAACVQTSGFSFFLSVFYSFLLSSVCPAVHTLFTLSVQEIFTKVYSPRASLQTGNV